MNFDQTSLPTADYALFLLNAVKFHCGQLYHLFDEATFMDIFARFHRDPDAVRTQENLWYIHYLLIMAFGKAFVVRMGRARRPPGADLFVHAMDLLPDTLFLENDPLQSIELLCCAALYFQCVDMRNAAFSKVSGANGDDIVYHTAED